MHELAAILLTTLLAEDLAVIGTGLLIHEGRVHPAAGLLVCASGIWIGDLGLWALGRAARAATTLPVIRALHTRLLAGRAPFDTTAFDRRLPTLLLASRLVPGTRLPLYLAAGGANVSLTRFAVWSLLAVAIWTPAVVLAAAAVGPPLADTAGRYLGSDRLWLLALALVVLVVTRPSPAAAARGVRRIWREHLHPRLGRARRWEFWPMWLFYAPVVAWTFWLAIRHSGYRTITAANPGIPDGGVVGESKNDIMRRLPRRWALTSILLPPAQTTARLRTLLDGMRGHGLAWPMVLKPDVGQRGVGVRLVRSLPEARAYLEAARAAVIAQPFHPGPFEAGIFYYRFPDEPRGRILSITDKVFPVVVGDGSTPLAGLVRSHDRYRLQASTFLARLGRDAARVPASGEVVPLGLAGNHAQGTMFLDGGHLITPALADRIDRIARHYEGFYVGRFDVRYSDVKAFTAGRDLAIVELNGATAESTDIYDPRNSLLRAYRRLFRQWSLVFAIGAANHAAGAAVTPRRRLLSLVQAHLVTPSTFPIAD